MFIQGIAVISDSLSDSEPLRFQLRLCAETKIHNAAVRLIVSNSTGQIIGMTSSDYFNMSEGETWRSFVMPTNSLGTGEYICDIVVFSFDRNVQVRHDFLSKVLPFTTVQSQLYFGSKWLSQKWGNVVFPKIDIEEMGNGETG